MQFTENLKNQGKKSESKDEEKKFVENAGTQLTDGDLDGVGGGIDMMDDTKAAIFTCGIAGISLGDGIARLQNEPSNGKKIICGKQI